MKLGRAVKWGDTGPRMLTRVLKELGCLERAVPASVCYPIHYSQALDALRPSQTAVLAPRIESSLFLHVWNSMLVHGAVAGVVGIESGVVSGVFNLESSGVRASDWRPRHDKRYHEA